MFYRSLGEGLLDEWIDRFLRVSLSHSIIRVQERIETAILKHFVVVVFIFGQIGGDFVELAYFGGRGLFDQLDGFLPVFAILLKRLRL